MAVALTIGLGAALVAVTLLVIVLCDRFARAGIDELLDELLPRASFSPERRYHGDR